MNILFSKLQKMRVVFDLMKNSCRGFTFAVSRMCSFKQLKSPFYFLLLLNFSFFCDCTLLGNLTRYNQKPSKDHTEWNSPVQLAYDFSTDFSSDKDNFPESDEGNDVIALADKSEMPLNGHQQKLDTSKNEETAEFIKLLLKAPY